MERRLTLRLMSYWERLRGDRPMPEIQEINAADLGDLWEHCLLVRVENAADPDYHYMHLGSAIMEACRHGSSGSFISLNNNKMTEKYPLVIARARPLMEEAETIGPQGDLVKYRQCLLPLGGPERVEGILGAMRFKVFTRN